MTKRLDRRTVLRATGVGLVATLAGCSGGSTEGDGSGSGGGSGDETTAPSPTPTETASGSSGYGSSPTDADTTASGGSGSFGGWMESVSNFDGVVDRTGRSEVTVEVGVQANGGAFGFGPPAIRVDSGTKVVWKWTGEGGIHNVAAESGSYESKMTDEAGFTFSHAFAESGTSKYACTPHRSLGMKGVVVVE